MYTAIVQKKKFNKKQLLKKFVEFPKTGIRFFFAKEMKLLNDLIDRYSIEFVDALSLIKKYDSMAVILSDSYKKELDKKFNNFNYKIDSSKYDIVTLSDSKSGEDAVIKSKPKTIRDFLNG